MMNALATADKAFRTWAARPFRERSKIIATAAQLLRKNKEELARLATLEMGKRIAESREEVELSASIVQYFADNAPAFLAPKKLNSVMGEAHLEYFTSGRSSQRSTLELPLLPVGPLRGATSYVRQCDTSQTRVWRPPMCASFEQVLQETGGPEGVYTNLFLSNDQAGCFIKEGASQIATE
jgi:succinate-semialdehyde dehydrogenase / glutarate-semialdehyde dehydrogenase